MLFFSSFIVTFTSIGDYFQENKKTKLNSGTFPFLYKNRPAQPPYFLVLWILLFLTFYVTMNRTGESASVFFFLPVFLSISPDVLLSSPRLFVIYQSIFACIVLKKSQEWKFTPVIFLTVFCYFLSLFASVPFSRADASRSSSTPV